MLLALGCTLWLSGILVLVYTEFGLHHQTQPPFAADLLFFLHTVPFMSAIALMPHARKMRETRYLQKTHEMQTSGRSCASLPRPSAEFPPHIAGIGGPNSFGANRGRSAA